jgi:serine/threonine-protein kinase
MEPETRIGGYRVVSLLGAGGMGEVYRAHDPKLDREVAIKILPEGMSADPERIARFQREARALAALQHPNIASIYGFEEDETHRFLVMELVEGKDLSERLGKGPIPVDEAVALAVQLTEGLAAAHEQGIVHRDLKPANIKITPGGELKILDFGLARAYGGDLGSDDDIASSPTITAAMTRAGVILGTAAYMSPEQARGEVVNQRADLWAFGVILFEMITGHQVFVGDTVSDTLAAVLRAELDWDTLPKDAPPNVRRVLRRCLTRNPKERLCSAADARLELQDKEQPDPGAPTAKRSPALPLAIGLLAIAVLAAAWMFKPTARGDEERLPTHLSLALPDGLQVASRDKLPLGVPQPCIAISDDGRLIVVVVERDDTTWIYRRFLDEPEGDLLEDTRDGYHPQISPDGSWISFMKGNALMRMGARADRATLLIELPNSFGHCWVNNSEIVINRAEATELLRIDAERGTATPYERKTVLDEYFWPSRVAGMDAIMLNSESHAAKSEEADMDQISFMDLSTEERTVLGIGGSMPRVLPGGPLLLVRDGLLMAAPFDLDRLGEAVRPVTALDGLLVEGWIGQYAVSQNGTLAYVPGEWLLGNELVWDDGRGNVEQLGFPLLSYGDFELSPDATRLAITVGGGVDTQVWIYDLERGARRLLTTDGNGVAGIWAPDGERIAYGTFAGDPLGIYMQTVGSNAPATLLYETNQPVRPYAWHDDVGILFSMDYGIFRIDPDAPGEPQHVVNTDASEWGPDISPDGRWFAYTSDESGRYEIYARAIGGDRSYSVSLDGGEEPIFSEDGGTIYYRYGNRFYATPILEASADGKRFRAGRPEVVVEGAYSNVPGLSYDVGPDGRLLLLRTDGGTERPGHLNVILNWDVKVER